MRSLQTNDEPSENAARKSDWLPALEKELKSRVGWVDEAVSPFAARVHAAPTTTKVAKHQGVFQPVKAA